MRRLAAVLVIAAAASAARADPPRPVDAGSTASAPMVGRLCALIAAEADRAGLPREFLARLIWKESRFDAQAISPAGAQGIAQFMPATARRRGLADPFDIEQAIPASAAFLAELRAGFGNLGLAAAAYNAGEDRVARWLERGGFLPLETEDYVLAITGEPADHFQDRRREIAARPLAPGLAFDQACRALPVTAAATTPMARIAIKPWGVQVAGNFREAAALRQFARVRARFPAAFEGRSPVVSRVRTPIGRRALYAVRIGADSRAEADALCADLRRAGGACVVMRNR